MTLHDELWQVEVINETTQRCPNEPWYSIEELGKHDISSYGSSLQQRYTVGSIYLNVRGSPKYVTNTQHPYLHYNISTSTANSYLHKINPLNTMLTHTKPKIALNTRNNSNHGDTATNIPIMICSSNDVIRVFFRPNLKRRAINTRMISLTIRW